MTHSDPRPISAMLPPHRPAPFGAVAVTIAPNGARRGRRDHPAMPLDLDNIVRTAVQCHEAGAAMIHLHIRDRDGRHLLDAAAYRDAEAAIRRVLGRRMIVQITTEAAGRYHRREQIAMLRAARPEAASLALREFFPDRAAEAEFAETLAWMAQTGVLPQIILYDAADARALDELCARGLVPWRAVPVLYVLGRYDTGAPARPADLLPFLAPDMPRFEHWTCCAFGADEAACVGAAALLGGGVRVGFENNLRLADGSLAPDNAALVAQMVAQLGHLGRRPDEADALRAAIR